jgi:single-strand DNA-binding protein
VEGRIQVRNYENNEGKRVYVTEVIADNVRFLESSQNREGGNAPSGGSVPEEPAYGGGGNSGRGNNNNFSRNNNNQDPFSGDGKPIDISDDDLPF